MSKLELKPCPFCGGKAKLIEHAFYNEKAKNFYDHTYSVKCVICQTESGSFFNKAENAINAWNRRASDDEAHAHWIEEYPQKKVNGKILYHCECSKCGYLADYATNYCPECGAKMDGEE